MKKKLTALFLALLTCVCIFAFSACRNGGDDPGKKDEPNLPDPEPIDGLTLIVGNWVVESLEVMPSGESGGITPSVPTDSFRLEIRENGEFTFSRYTDKDEFYEGKAENGIALNYYEFSCVMGETTVTASAYLAPDGKLNFNTINFEGGNPTANYMSCTCVRGV